MYIVIGATGDIGSSVARLLVSNGKEVMLIGRTQEKLEALTERLNSACQPRIPLHTVQCDASDYMRMLHVFRNILQVQKSGNWNVCGIVLAAGEHRFDDDPVFGCDLPPQISPCNLREHMQQRSIAFAMKSHFWTRINPFNAFIHADRITECSATQKTKIAVVGSIVGEWSAESHLLANQRGYTHAFHLVREWGACYARQFKQFPSFSPNMRVFPVPLVKGRVAQCFCERGYTDIDFNSLPTAVDEAGKIVDWLFSA